MVVVPLLVMSILKVTVSLTVAVPDTGTVRVLTTVTDGRVVTTWALTGPAETAWLFWSVPEA
jgi:hypothetical protein